MEKTTSKKVRPFKKLKLSGKYNSFPQFYDQNKEMIYRTIVDVFEAFKTKKNANLLLVVSAKIEDIAWKTEFNFNRKESIILKRDIMPYFEEIEDYETCERIKNLHKELTLTN